MRQRRRLYVSVCLCVRLLCPPSRPSQSSISNSTSPFINVHTKHTQNRQRRGQHRPHHHGRGHHHGGGLFGPALQQRGQLPAVSMRIDLIRLCVSIAVGLFYLHILVSAHPPQPPTMLTAHPQPDGLPPHGLRAPRHLPDPGRRRPHFDDAHGRQHLVASEGLAGSDQGRGAAVVID